MSVVWPHKLGVVQPKIRVQTSFVILRKLLIASSAHFEEMKIMARSILGVYLKGIVQREYRWRTKVTWSIRPLKRYTHPRYKFLTLTRKTCRNSWKICPTGRVWWWDPPNEFGYQGSELTHYCLEICFNRFKKIGSDGDVGDIEDMDEEIRVFQLSRKRMCFGREQITRLSDEENDDRAEEDQEQSTWCTLMYFISLPI